MKIHVVLIFSGGKKYLWQWLGLVFYFISSSDSFIFKLLFEINYESTFGIGKFSVFVWLPINLGNLTHFDPFFVGN